MPVADFLARVQRDVDSHLQRFMADLPADTLRDAMEYSVFNGGKRIRPALCYAAAEIFAPATELTHRAAAALELVHAYSLIHDDLPGMDNDELRRGKPTCHIAFGEATAILAGDGLQALAFEVLAGAPARDGADPLAMIRALATACGARGMVLGQSIDLAAVDHRLDHTRLETMHRYKTGALIGASIELGAGSTGGAGARDLVALHRYADAVGLAFQVKDDILDVESPTETLGKRQGADQARNKPTYTSLLGLEGAARKLEELRATAAEAAAYFGDRGKRLAAIADFIVQRTH